MLDYELEQMSAVIKGDTLASETMSHSQGPFKLVKKYVSHLNACVEEPYVSICKRYVSGCAMTQQGCSFGFLRGHLWNVILLMNGFSHVKFV